MVCINERKLREGLARLFADGGHAVVPTLGDAACLEEILTRDKPDLVVIDVRMPPTHTDEGAREVKDRRPNVGVLVLSPTHRDHARGRAGFPGRIRLPAQGPRPRSR